MVQNCTTKLPPDLQLHKRYQRLCPTCVSAPLDALTDPLCVVPPPDQMARSARSRAPPSSHPPAQPKAFTYLAFRREPCRCAESVWICECCGLLLRQQGRFTESAWLWRSKLGGALPPTSGFDGMPRSLTPSYPCFLLAIPHLSLHCCTSSSSILFSFLCSSMLSSMLSCSLSYSSVPVPVPSILYSTSLEWPQLLTCQTPASQMTYLETVPCALGSSCLAAQVVDTKVAVEYDDTSPSLATETVLPSRLWPGSWSPERMPGYSMQEMEGVGGLMKRTKTSRVLVGAPVLGCAPSARDAFDPSSTLEELRRSKGGAGSSAGPAAALSPLARPSSTTNRGEERLSQVRSWCGWCRRVVPSTADRESYPDEFWK